MTPRPLATPARRAPGRRHPLRALVIALALLALLVLYAFGRQSLASGRDFRALFASGNELKSGSVVRVAGLDVGTVRKVEASPDGPTLVVMRLKDDAPVVRTDVRLAIKPRLAFEGNFYVDVEPGSRTSRALPEGAVVPERQTTTPVQLDQLLSTFDRPVLRSAKDAVGALAAGLGAGNAIAAPPGVPTGATGLRRAARELRDASRTVRMAAQAAQGTRSGDLGRALGGTAGLARTVARDPAALAELVTSYRRTVGALAQRDAQLGASLRGASSLLRVAPASLRRIDGALPGLERFAKELRPALAAIPAPADAASDALDQIRAATRPGRELPAVIDALDPPIRRLPGLERQVAFAAPLVRSIGRCLTNTVVPALNKQVPDGKLSSGQPVWKEFLHLGAGLASGSMGFDANGSTFRAGLGEGDQSFTALVSNGQQLSTVLSNGSAGVRPSWIGPQSTEKRPDQPCEDQKVVDYASSALGLKSRMKAAPNPNAGRTTAETHDDALSSLATLRDKLAKPAGKDGGR